LTSPKALVADNMRARSIPLLLVLHLVLCRGNLWAQEAPVETSPCELAANPKKFDGKLIRIRAAVNVYFEDFSLSTPGCNSLQGIWLAFGGDVPGIVASMVNDTFRQPGVNVKVNGISYAIKKDESFRRFYALISATHGNKPAYRATATLTGPFFAGSEQKSRDGRVSFGGYGHLGCCSLLLITEVSDPESDPPADLNLRGKVTAPDGKPAQGIVVIDDVLGGFPPQRQKTKTDAAGLFQFSDSGQLIRIEDASYRPVALPVEPGGSPVNVKLENAGLTDWIVPPCAATRGKAAQFGFTVLFALPNSLEAKPFDIGDDHSFFVVPRGHDISEADLIISKMENAGEETTSPAGAGRSQQRWLKDTSGTVIGIDASGRDRDGTRWRSVTFLGRDIAGYTRRRGKKTGLLDSVIDSACIKQP